MALWLQNVLVILLVGMSLAYCSVQAVRAVRGKKSKLGSCCAKGCGESAPKQSGTERIVFLPSDMLRRKQ